MYKSFPHKSIQTTVHVLAIPYHTTLESIKNNRLSTSLNTVYVESYTSQYIIVVLHSRSFHTHRTFNTLFHEKHFTLHFSLLCHYSDISVLELMIHKHVYSSPCILPQLMIHKHVYSSPCILTQLMIHKHVYSSPCILTELILYKHVYSSPCILTELILYKHVYSSPCILMVRR